MPRVHGTIFGSKGSKRVPSCIQQKTPKKYLYTDHLLPSNPLHASAVQCSDSDHFEKVVVFCPGFIPENREVFCLKNSF